MTSDTSVVAASRGRATFPVFPRIVRNPGARCPFVKQVAWTGRFLNDPGRFILAVVLAPVLVLSGTAHADEKPCRAYFVGNSVTDTIRYGSFARLAQSRGHTLNWGRHMIPGAPLQWIWEHPADGFQAEPFGLYPRALAEFPWDVLSLEPFDRHLDGKDGDLSMAGHFINLALKQSPDLQVYVYSRWPRKDKAKDGSLVLDFKTRWLRKYTGGWNGTEETRDYFERVVAGLRKAYDGKARPALLVPVGDVLLELHERMRAGRVPGFTDIAQVYADGIHFNNVGSYVVGTTFFTTLFREDPRGLTADPYNEKLDPMKDRLIDDNLAAAIQDAVWSVVSKHPLAGVLRASSQDATSTKRSYSTRFLRDENPISEGGKWKNGGKDGVDWYNVMTRRGVAHGAVSQGAYTDPTALLAGTWGKNQKVKAGVFSRNQTEKYYQEVEIRLRSTLTPHVCTGYEVFWRCLKTRDAYVEIVRWNGKVGDWTSLQKHSGAQFGVKDGDLVEATIVGNVIKGYVSGVEVISATDSTYKEGNPGIGFNYGVENSNRDFGFTSYEVESDDR